MKSTAATKSTITFNDTTRQQHPRPQCGQQNCTTNFARPTLPPRHQRHLASTAWPRWPQEASIVRWCLRHTNSISDLQRAASHAYCEIDMFSRLCPNTVKTNAPSTDDDASTHCIMRHGHMTFMLWYGFVTLVLLVTSSSEPLQQRAVACSRRKRSLLQAISQPLKGSSRWLKVRSETTECMREALQEQPHRVRITMEACPRKAQSGDPILDNVMQTTCSKIRLLRFELKKGRDAQGCSIDQTPPGCLPHAAAGSSMGSF